MRPAGYRVVFTIVNDWDVRHDGWSGTGAGEVIAYSLRHVASIMRKLSKRQGLRAEVIPVWGVLA